MGVGVGEGVGVGDGVGLGDGDGVGLGVGAGVGLGVGVGTGTGTLPELAMLPPPPQAAIISVSRLADAALIPRNLVMSSPDGDARRTAGGTPLNPGCRPSGDRNVGNLLLDRRERL